MSKILSYFDTEAFAVFYKTSTVHDRRLCNLDDKFIMEKDGQNPDEESDEEVSDSVYKRSKPVYLWLEKFMPAVY